MSNAEQASEPSMEDILSSIRKIIAEEPDDALKPEGRNPGAAAQTNETIVGAGKASDVAAVDDVVPIAAVAAPGSAAKVDTAPVSDSGMGSEGAASDKPLATTKAAAPVVPAAASVVPAEQKISDLIDLKSGDDVPGPVQDTGNPDEQVDAPSVAPAAVGGEVSAFDALLAASAAPTPTAPTATAPPAPKQVSKETAPPAAVTTAQGALSIPLPNVKNIGMPVVASDEVCEADADGLDDLMSLLDDTPVKQADGSGASRAGADEGTQQPSPAAASDKREAEAPKPDDSLGPLLARIDTSAEINALASAREEPAAAATQDLGASLPTGPGAVTSTEAAKPFSKLLQNLGASSDTADQGDIAEVQAKDTATASGAAADNGASAVAATAALGALAAGIAGTSDEDQQDDAGEAAEPANMAPAAVDDEPPSEIASLGALLAAAPGSLTDEAAAPTEAAAGPQDDDSSDDGSMAMAAADDMADGAGPPTVADQGPESADEQQASGKDLVAPVLGDVMSTGNVKTMEDTVSELLRPMLRDWLDAHMPRIVEKALKVELACAIDGSAIDGDVEGDGESGKGD